MPSRLFCENLNKRKPHVGLPDNMLCSCMGIGFLYRVKLYEIFEADWFINVSIGCLFFINSQVPYDAHSVITHTNLPLCFSLCADLFRVGAEAAALMTST
jgi:hypothetical protein